MTTWQEAWDEVEQHTGLGQRVGQQILGQKIFDTVYNGGQLVAEAPTGTGKSLAALIPVIQAFKDKKQRTILTTETLSLLDQIVDKDLPLLQSIFGDFEYFGLKGRNHYLCIAKAGTQHPIVLKVRQRLDGTNGERRDVEKILGYRMKDDDWEEIAGEVEHCSNNKCKAEACWSTRARDKAASADIVITSHAMLQVHGEFIQRGEPEGLLGAFHHVIIDEAHSLEQVIVDGMTLEVAPWELYKKMNAVTNGYGVLAEVGLDNYVKRGLVADIETNTKEIIQEFRTQFISAVGANLSMFEHSRESLLLNRFPMSEEFAKLLEDTIQDYEVLGKSFAAALEDGDIKRGKGKVNKAISACSYMSRLLWLIYAAAISQNGFVEAYATTYSVFIDGLEGRDRNNNPRKEIRIRAVPMDISQFLRGNIWKTARSVTLLSATLRDYSDNTFRFLKRSVGLASDCPEVVVASPFNLADQQLIYITPGGLTDKPQGISGVRYSPSEVRSLIDVSDGKSLVLFTALAELNYMANELRNDPNFPHTLLVQEKGVDKTMLADTFKSDTNSVLLASKSFFQGFDAAGETLTTLIMAKYSLPQYNATTKALIAFWRSNGFPNWYESKSIETFVQAFGRLIRSDQCRGVVALLDERAADPKQSVYRTVYKVINQVYSGVEVTSDLNRVKEWLNV